MSVTAHYLTTISNCQVTNYHKPELITHETFGIKCWMNNFIKMTSLKEAHLGGVTVRLPYNWIWLLLGF